MKNSTLKSMVFSFFVALFCTLHHSELAAQEASGHVSYHQLFSSEAPGSSNMIIQQYVNRGVVVTDDPKSPFSLSTQTCSGTNMISSGGQPVKSYGSCDVIDQEGDIWFLTFHNDFKNSSFTWDVTGGIGKYKNMKGGGTTTPLTSSADGKMLTISFKGSTKM